MSPEHLGQCYHYRLRLRRNCVHSPPPGRHGGEAVRPVFYVRRGGGWGEAAPGARSGETAAETGRTLERLLADLASHPRDATPLELAASLKERHPLAPAARAAVEMAAFDEAARAQSLPLHAHLRLPSPEGIASSFRLTLSSEADLEASLDAARDFSCLKVKCSGDARRDLELIKWLAAHAGKPLRIDAGGGWTLAEARGILEELRQGRVEIEYLEQPLARRMVEETAHLLRQSHAPLLLDEDACGAGDLARIATACNGFVIKLMTSGGLAEALRMIREGRQLGLRIALDTTAESTLAVTAAAHLAGAADYADLSAPLLLENDPFEGVRFVEGKIRMPEGAGVGARLRAEYRDCFHHPYGR